MTPTIQNRLIRSELINNVLMGDQGSMVSSKIGRGKHLEPGVVAYDNEDGSRITYLLTREAIEAMRPSAKGIPLVGAVGGFDHMKVNAADKASGKYDGEVLESYNGTDGWEWMLFQIKDDKTAAKCADGYQLSCAYIPTEVDETPGVWHNVPYDAIIRNGAYTHLAVVPNPRYEGAEIELLNSKKEPIMNKVLKAALALFPIKDVKEVINSLEEDKKKEAEEAAKAEKEKKNAERADKRAAAQEAYDSAMKNASNDEDREKAKSMLEKMNAEIDAPAGEAAEKKDGDLPKKPLGGGDVTPEPGTPGHKVEAKNAEDEKAKEKEKADKEALEKKNAEDKDAKEKADKEAEEKKNADDAAKKAEDEKKKEDERKNALEIKTKATAEAKAEVLRVERFNALRAAAEERGGDAGSPFVGVVTQTEKEDLGRARYGSGQK